MFFKLFMLWMLMITIIISMSSKFWFLYWLMMEMNLMMFIPILNNKKIYSCNSMMSYFIIQSISSSIFFFGSIMWFCQNLFFFKNLIIISILIKLAMFPFHSWLLMISETLNFFSLSLMLTMQKMIPLLFLSKISEKLLIIMAIMSSTFGSILMINLKLTRKILISSSISHLGWISILISFKSKFWFIYMIMYSYIIIKLFHNFNKNKIYSMNNILNKNYSNNEMINYFCMMLSLGGIPPFLGFFMKLFSMIIILKYSFYIMIILIMSSLLNIFIYIRMIMPFLIFKKNLMKKMISPKNFWKIIFNLNLFFLIFVLNFSMY
uniref:NADH-ubiquinone oxidoreductase chain 2 n=1 Tax=Robertsicus elaphensis TaxID=2599317 RepID=H9M760_9ACAR|nr:NADH dehydrogenase subunit 2 [Robertsicus elaphensis]AET63077.1 NADH dehydrogenase subunit 2 [Robertsicus elaphensis]